MSSSPWESVDLSPWEDNPEAFTGTPTGAAQVAPEVAAAQHAQESGQPLSPWASVDFTDASKSWFGGRNVEGERNGWDSDFFRKAQVQYEDAQKRAAAENNPNIFFSRFDPEVNREATGIVTWDDPARGLRAGDVFEDGKFVNNLIVDFGWRDAATMMAPVLFTADEQGRLFEEGGQGDNTPLIEATQAKIAEMTQQAAKAPTAYEFSQLVEQKKVEDGGTESAVGSFAAGAGAGAAAGAVLGSVVPVLGTAVGAVGGALLGGAAAYLNRDQMTELVARTQAQAEIAEASTGDWDAWMARLSGWSQVGMTAASPLQNILQGVTDSKLGELGDGVSEYYALDPVTKERKVPLWLEGLNLTASVGDAFSQFASVPARALYMTSMGTTVAAGVGQNLTGRVFDPTAGAYHDMEGLGEHAAAWGNVGIDALQMSVAGMLSKVTRNQRGILGVEGQATHTAAAATDPLVTGTVARAAERARSVVSNPSLNVDRAIDRVWARARGKELPENYTTQELNGMRYFFGEDLAHPVMMRMTAQVLVPSEFTKFIPTGFLARSRMAADRGLPTADDMYSTSLAMFRSGHRFSNAFFNAQAEGWEEAAQAILEPASYGETAQGGDIVRAGAMGFAAGMGMSLGTAIGAPTSARRAEALARRAYTESVGRQVSTEEWRTIADSMGPDMVAVWARMSKDQSQDFLEYAKMVSEFHQYESGPSNVLGPAVADVVVKAAMAQQARASVPATGGTVLALGRSPRYISNGDRLEASQYEANEVVTSLWRLWQTVEKKVEATRLHVQEAESRIAELGQTLAGTTDPQEQADLQAQIDSIRVDMADMGAVQARVEQFAKVLHNNWDMFRTSSPDVRAGIIRSLNESMRYMGQGREANGAAAASPEVAEQIMRSVELFASRNPLLSTGSFVRFVPQLSEVMSTNGQDAAWHMPQTSLKALNADHDGDFMKMISLAYIPPTARLAYRLGGQYIFTEDGRKKVAIDKPDADKHILAQMREIFLDPTGDKAGLVNDELDEFDDWLRTRYTPELGSEAVEAAISQFRSDVMAGVADARINLAENLLNADTQAFMAMGLKDQVPESNRLLEMVSLVWERATMATAIYDQANLANDPGLDPAEILEQRRWIKEIPQLMAETYGVGLAYALATPDGQRVSQQLSYLVIKTAINLSGLKDLDAVMSDTVVKAANALMQLSSGKTQSALAEQQNDSVVLGRVKQWLLDAAEFADEFIDPQGLLDLTKQEKALMLGSLSARVFQTIRGENGVDETVIEDEPVSVIQMLLRTSIQMERKRLMPASGAAPTDLPEWQVLDKLDRLTHARGDRSYTASSALIEVFGGEYLSTLLGPSSALAGPDMPLSQLMKSIYGLHEDFGRKQLIERLTIRSPLHTPGVGDPPYAPSDFVDKGISPYSLVTNALRAVAQNHDSNLAERDKTAHATALEAFGAIKDLIAAYKPLVAERIQKKSGQKREVTDAEVLADLLSWNRELGDQIAQLMPVDALRATFARDAQGQLVAANWVNQALLEKTEKAVFMFWVHSKLDHMTLLRHGWQDLSADPVDAAGEAALASGSSLDNLESRFEQLVLEAFLSSSADGGLAVLELKKLIATSNSLPEFMERLNSNPRLRTYQAPLLAWYDDASEFQTTTQESQHRAMPSAALREKYATAATRLQQMAKSTAAATNMHIADQQKKQRMLARVRDAMNGVYDDTHNPLLLKLAPDPEIDPLLDLAWKALKRAPLTPDGVGITARRNALAAVQVGVHDQTNKGAADANLEALGVFLPLLAGGGLKLGLSLELDNITSMSYEEAMSNPSKLSEGVTRVELPGGATVLVDLTNMLSFLEAWSDPRTEQLVNAVIFPNLRDVGASGAVQIFSAYDTSGGMEGMLHQSTNAQFVNTKGGTPDYTDAAVFLSMVEAGTLKASEVYPVSTPAGKTVRQDHTLAIELALMDLINAYQLGPQLSKKSPLQVQEALVRNYAQTLIEIAHLSKPERKLALELLNAKLLKQQTGSEALFDELRLDDETRRMLNAELGAVAIEMTKAAVKEVQDGLAAATTEYEKKFWETKRDLVAEDAKATPLEKILGLNQVLGIDLVRAQQAFKIDWSDQASAESTMARLIEFLGVNDNVLHFRNLKQTELVEKIPRLRSIMVETGRLNAESLTQAEWDLLSEWCVRVYISDRSGATGGQFGISALKTPLSVKYFDPGFTVLTEPLFDELTLKVVVRLMEDTGYGQVTNPELNPYDVADRAMSRLFNPKQMPRWSAVFPSVAMKTRQAMLVTPVKTAVAAGGTSPTDMFEVMGSGRVSLRLPDAAAHETEFAFDWQPAVDVWRTLNLADKRMPLKLEHHFVRSIVIEDATGTVPVTDITSAVGRLGLTLDAAPNSPYQVLELDRLQNELEKLAAQHSVPGFTVKIQYVDIDKKPFAPEWANNMFFEGVGREYETNFANSLAASLMFSTNGVNNIGQQVPLDFTADNSSYVAYVTQPRERGMQIERAYKTVTETLERKVRHLLAQDYETGRLQPGDIPSLMKLVRNRHLVKRVDAEGVERIMWSEEAIALEQAELRAQLDAGVLPADLVYTPYVPIPLKEESARVLLGGANQIAVPGLALGQPSVNPTDINTFPELTEEVLEQAGLSELGTTVPLSNSVFAQMRPLPRDRMLPQERGAGSPRDATFIRISHESTEVMFARAGTRGFDINGINEKGKDQLIRMFRRDAGLTAVLTEVLPEGSTAENNTALALVQAQQLDAVLESPHNVVWRYVGGDSISQMLTGGITRHDVNQDFGWKGQSPIKMVQGDVFVLDLGLLLGEHGGDLEASFQDAKALLRSISLRGLRFVLQSSTGPQRLLRSSLEDWVKDGEINYQGMQQSPYFFEPITRDNYVSVTERVRQRSLSATTVFTAMGAEFAFIMKDEPALNEGAVYADLPSMYDWARDVTVQLPSHLSNLGPHTENNVSYAIVRNTPNDPNVVHRFAEDALEIFRQPGAAAALGLRIPPGVPVRSVTETPDGKVIIQPGILSPDDALAELADLLESGRDLYVGRTLRPGALIPYRDQRGELIIHQYGFELPTEKMISEARARGPKMYNGAARPLIITVSEPKLARNETIPPDFIIKELVYTQKGLRARGDARLDKNAKLIWQAMGFKAGLMEMPEHFRMATRQLGLLDDNDIHITQFAGTDSAAGKGAVRYRGDNFADGFAMFGFNSIEFLTEFFGRFESDTELNWGVIKKLLNDWSKQPLDIHEDHVRDMLQKGGIFGKYRDEMYAVFGPTLGDQFDAFFDVLNDRSDDPAQRISEVILACLLLPGVQLPHVIGTPGIINVSDPRNSKAQIVRVNEIMSGAFDDQFHYPNTYQALFDHMNSHLAPGFKLRNNWDFEITMESPAGTPLVRVGKLQYILPVAAEQNLATYLQRFIMNRWDNVTPFTGAMVSAAFGGRVPNLPQGPDKTGDYAEGVVRAKTKLAEWTDGTLQEQLAEDGGPLGWFNNPSSFTRLKVPGFSSWGLLNYAERRAVLEGQAAARLYTIPIPKGHEHWDTSTAEHFAYISKLNDSLRELNMEENETNRNWLETMVRQMLGIPGPSSDQDASVGYVSLSSALQAASLIYSNIKDNYVPTRNGSVPLLHLDMWRVIFDAQQKPGVVKPWSPKRSEADTRKIKVESAFDNWVVIAVGQVLSQEAPFASMFRAALDGMWQSYNGATLPSENMTVSFSTAEALGLRSRRLDDSYRDALSFSMVRDNALRTPIVTNAQEGDIDNLMGRVLTYDASSANNVSSSEIMLHHRRQASWRAQKKMTKQDDQTPIDYRTYGARYMENNNRANIWARNLSTWSLVNRMANFGIWTSALIDVPFRRYTEYLTNIVEGNVLGRTGEALARTPLSRYTDREVQLIEAIISYLGDSKLFMADVQNQIAYTIVGDAADPTKSPGNGRFTQGLERLAAGMVRWMSDPWHGMRGDTLVREYLYGVLKQLELTNNAITIEQLAEQIIDNGQPLYIKKSFSNVGLSPHKAGMNSVAQNRAIKHTMMSQPVRWMLDGLTSRPGALSNIGGHLLRMPLMFQVFTFNQLTTMTGMSGWDQAAAMFLSGRRKPKFLSSKANRELGDAAPQERWDFSDVIETVDLQHTFIKSNITFSMLMALGLMAGNLGLDGEDEEAKRRARLAKYLNIPLQYDPYEPQNSFMYADAIFLDSIPFLDTFFKDSRGESAVVPHWILRQFTSPIMGIQRFFDTGDIREIGYGFGDALSVMPNSLVRLWNQAELLAGQLSDEAVVSSEYDSTEMSGATNNFLINIVTVYEKMLAENAFINTLYTARDEFDRDPYVITKTENGQIVRGPDGLPLASTVTTTVIGPDGKPTEVYQKRDDFEAFLHGYTENNATAAVIGSLFTGLGESQWLRSNMVTKQPTIELPKLNADQAKAMILSAYYGGGSEFRLSKLDLVRMIKQRIQEAGGRWDQTAVENQADEILAAHDARTSLSIGTDKGEVITQYGAERVYHSLLKGSVKLGDPGLAGMAIPYEMRKEVAASLIKEIMQEAIDKGLSYESAYYVAQRMWYGEKDNPDMPGLRSYLESDKISYNNVVKYNQLNVMYAIGPDGRPWATPFARNNVFQALGIPVPNMVRPAGPGTHHDNLGNVVDDVLGINTGIAAIVRQPTKPLKMPDIFKQIKKEDFTKGGGSYGRRYGGGGGGGGSSYGPPFQRMYELAGGTSDRFGGIPMINTSNPYIRRAQVNRERVFGERGRLKQWQ